MGHVDESQDKSPGTIDGPGEGDEVAIELDTPENIDMVTARKSKRGRGDWAAVDRAAVFHSIKVGLAVVLASFLVLVTPVYEWMGHNAVWGVISVIVMYEPTLGGVLSKGFNRGMGTILAGLLALGAGRAAAVAGQIGESIAIGTMLFLAGAVVTYLRSIPKLRSQYDYGLVVASLTFCFLLVLGRRVPDDTRAAGLRILSVVIAFLIVLILSLLWPHFASSELHNGVCDNFSKLACAMEICVAEYVKGARHMAVPMVWSGQADDDPVHRSYHDIVLSKSLEDSLGQLTNWETGHWPFVRYFPWHEFADVSKNLRQCAYGIIAMDGCLRSEIQAPTILRQLLASELLLVSLETSRVAFLLGASIRMRLQVHASDLLQGMDHAAQNLQRSVRDIAPMLVLRSRSLSEERDGFMMVDGDEVLLHKGRVPGSLAEGGVGGRAADGSSETPVAGTPLGGDHPGRATPLMLASWTNYSPSPRSSSEHDRGTFRAMLAQAAGGGGGGALSFARNSISTPAFGRVLSSDAAGTGSITPRTPAHLAAMTMASSWGRTLSVPPPREGDSQQQQPAAAAAVVRTQSDNDGSLGEGATDKEAVSSAPPGEGRSLTHHHNHHHLGGVSPVAGHGMMYEGSPQWPDLTLQEYEALVAANGGETPARMMLAFKRGWVDLSSAGCISRDLGTSTLERPALSSSTSSFGGGGIYEAMSGGSAGPRDATATTAVAATTTTTPSATPRSNSGRALSPLTPHSTATTTLTNPTGIGVVALEPSPGLPPLPPSHAPPPAITPAPTPTRPPLAPRVPATPPPLDDKRRGSHSSSTAVLSSAQGLGVGGSDSVERPNVNDLRPSSYLVLSGKRFASGGLLNGGEADDDDDGLNQKRRRGLAMVGKNGVASDVRFFSGPQERKPGSSGIRGHGGNGGSSTHLFPRSSRSPWSSSSFKAWIKIGSSSTSLQTTTEVVPEESEDHSSRGASDTKVLPTSSSARDPAATRTSVRSRFNRVHRISLSDLPGLSREYESIAALSLVTFASLLVESVARIEALVQAVEVFGEKAQFKKADLAELEEKATAERNRTHRQRERRS